VAGVDVGGLDMATARARLAAALAHLPQPIRLRAGAEELTVEPETIKLAAPIDALLASAADDLRAGRPAAVPASLRLDQAALRTQLAILAERAAAPPQIQVISSTTTISRSFAYTPGRMLDVDAALAQITQRVAAGKPFSGTLKLELADDPAAPRVSDDRLLAEVHAMADAWDGVVGFYLRDQQSGAELGLHERSVFAGASTIKVAILLNAYRNLPTFTAKQEFWLGEMIKYSDNIAANNLLAAAAGGTGTEYAFKGAEQMSSMLADDLGLENLYLYIPYESGDYIKQNKVKYRCGPKDPVGPKPYTETGCALRATPYAIAQVYKAIDSCANGAGPLLKKATLLSPQRCQEMLDRLATNADKTRLVAGLPKGIRAEHKSGWIENLQADAGLVRSPGGDYILAVYVYKKLTGGRFMWPDSLMAPAVAAFSRLAYTAYNPIRLP
jgi:beta-lactamase class A